MPSRRTTNEGSLSLHWFPRLLLRVAAVFLDLCAPCVLTPLCVLCSQCEPRLLPDLVLSAATSDLGNGRKQKKKQQGIRKAPRDRSLRAARICRRQSLRRDFVKWSL